MGRYAGVSAWEAKRRKRLATLRKVPSSRVPRRTLEAGSHLQYKAISDLAIPGDSWKVKRGETVDVALKRLRKRAQKASLHGNSLPKGTKTVHQKRGLF